MYSAMSHFFFFQRMELKYETFFLHGSEDSLDKDVAYIVPVMPPRNVCVQFGKDGLVVKYPYKIRIK